MLEATAAQGGKEWRPHWPKMSFRSDLSCPIFTRAWPFFKDKLGVPEFLFIEKPELQDETYLGKPAPLRLHLAFGWCGDTQVELIQPIAGRAPIRKFLDHNPQGGMHHYGIEIPDYAKGVKEMEAKRLCARAGRPPQRNEIRLFRHHRHDRRLDRDRLSAAGRKGVHAQPEAEEITQAPRHVRAALVRGARRRTGKNF